MAKDCNMGMGRLVDPGVIFKRKFRWGLTIIPRCTKKSIEEVFVKVASRPNISFEETEINMKNGKFYIPGKATWETITVTFYDVSGVTVNEGTRGIYEWLASLYAFHRPDSLRNFLCMGSAQKDYSARAELRMYTGCGDVLEYWELNDVWPQSINWGELDYSSSEEATIEITMRYSDVYFNPQCFEFDAECCTTC